MTDNETPTTYPIPADLLPLFMDGDTFRPDVWWWGFDTFLTRLVGIAAGKLMGSGFPCPHMGDGSCDCQREWVEYLTTIRDDLAGYETYASYATDKQTERVQNALRRFIDRMGQWWD